MRRPRRRGAAALGWAAILGMAALALALVPEATPAGDSLEGRVLAVQDGDSLLVEVEGERRRVRIAGIDAPERAQPWSRRAREALRARVSGREVRINAVAVDRYGRTVGEVYADDVCVGCELVREGHAWAFRRYDPDPILLELEAQAREAGRGLWGLPEPERVPPWEWRRIHPPEHRREAERRDARERKPTPTGCGSKRRCAEMRDCAEARFHLERCGVTTLDGDGDGVPCEVLCRAD